MSASRQAPSLAGRNVIANLDPSELRSFRIEDRQTQRFRLTDARRLRIEGGKKLEDEYLIGRGGKLVRSLVCSKNGAS